MLTGVFLFGCHANQPDAGNKKKAGTDSAAITKQSPFYGEWSNYGNAWLNCVLIFSKNGTFKFHSRGCYAYTFSEGNWELNGQDISLTSFDTYKPAKTQTVAKTRKSEIYTPPKIYKKASVAIYTIDTTGFTVDTTEFITTIKQFNQVDTYRVYLDKVIFHRAKDTLYSDQKNGLFDNIGFRHE